MNLHISAQSGPVVYSFYVTVLYVTVTHTGVIFREHIIDWKCACIQPQLLSTLPVVSRPEHHSLDMN